MAKPVRLYFALEVEPEELLDELEDDDELEEELLDELDDDDDELEEDEELLEELEAGAITESESAS